MCPSRLTWLQTRWKWKDSTITAGGNSVTKAIIAKAENGDQKSGDIAETALPVIASTPIEIQAAAKSPSAASRATQSQKSGWEWLFRALPPGDW